MEGNTRRLGVSLPSWMQSSHGLDVDDALSITLRLRSGNTPASRFGLVGGFGLAAKR